MGKIPFYFHKIPFFHHYFDIFQLLGEILDIRRAKLYIIGTRVPFFKRNFDILYTSLSTLLLGTGHIKHFYTLGTF